MRRPTPRCACAALMLAAGCSRSTPPATPVPAGGTTAAITPADLSARLSIYADDSMQGRKAGTPGNVKATAYLAAEARRLGLQPAGDSGGYFQTIPLVDRTPVSAASVQAGGESFALGRDFIPRDQGNGARAIDGVTVIDAGTVDFTTGSHGSPPPEATAGKLVVVRMAPQADGTPAGTVSRAAVTQHFAGAAGIAVVTLDAIDTMTRLALQSSGAQLAPQQGPEQPAFLYVTGRMGEALVRAGTVHGTVAFMSVPAPAPARNVVAVLPGSDPALRGEYVAVGAHNDHIGLAPAPVDHDSLRAWNTVMRPRGADDSPGTPTPEQEGRIRAILDSLRKIRPPRADSVFNGADDDGSGSVSVLEIAEALAKSGERPKRSVLFVWHTGEELGLLGSDWFTRHPTVPRDSIVAQLNIDMIGRGDAGDQKGGGPGYVQLIGTRRLSTELGDLIERVNTEDRHGLEFNYDWDADGHPDNSYCRSDHYMYARFGIPIAFFTTGDHRDYHQLTDEVQYMDFAKMARVAGLVEDVARQVADLDHRLVVDKPKPDPEAPCRQ
ncbi:MAG: M28 family metallopeptidase [Gemmatimonadales bacterium]